jgi:hypothetical protein
MRLAFAAAAGAAIIAGSASASTLVDVTRDSNPFGTGGFAVQVGSQSVSADGGRFDYSYTPVGGGDTTSVRTFCIEIGENARSLNNVDLLQGSGIMNAAPNDDSGLNSANRAELLDDQDLRALSYLFENHYADVVESGSRAAVEGFQLAIWDIVYERAANDGDAISYGIGIGEGHFYVNTTYGAGTDKALAVSEANRLLGLVASNVATQEILGSLIVLSADNFQDQITMIPLPAPVLMGLAGLGAAIAGRRRMMRG